MIKKMQERMGGVGADRIPIPLPGSMDAEQNGKINEIIDVVNSQERTVVALQETVDSLTAELEELKFSLGQ